MSEPKEPKKASISWSPPGELHANKHEILFWSFLLVRNASSYGALDKWAKEAHSEYSAATILTSAWKPSERHFGTYMQVSAIFAPMVDVMKISWGLDDLATIGTAMRAATWHPGQHDELDARRLSDHINGERRGVRPPKSKRQGPQRWRTWSIVLVADVIKRHRKTLQALLGLDKEMEEVPTAADVIAARDATIVELRDDKAELLEELRKEKDKLRKAAARNKAALERKTKAVRSVREQQQEKARQKIAAALEKEKQRLETKGRLIEEGLTAKYANDYTLALAKVAKARARARKVESEAKLSRKRLKRAQTAEATVKEMEEEPPNSPDTDDEPAAKLGRRDEHGRFRAEPWQHRVLEWAQLARGVPPSTINRNITEVLTLFASEEMVPLACERQMRKLRGEVTIAGEMIAALRVALCTRIISFGFDESTKFGLGLLSTNTQIEPHDAPGTSVDVVMRGVTLTAGGTAEAISKDIDEKLFAHARRLLTLWKAEHELMYGKGSWEKADMPFADNIGLHRLSENAVIMSDTCNAARATKRLVAEMAEKAGRERIGTEVWEKMTQGEREAKCQCHLGDCHDHLRNIIIKAMATAATDYLKGRLGDDLDAFSSYDRMSVDPTESIRAACKELHPDGEYAKGKGRESEATRKRDHPSDLWLPIFNAVGNSRMDAVFDGAVPLYMDRLIILSFIHPLVHGPDSKDNILEKFLWRTLESTEMVGLLRTSASAPCGRRC